MKIYGRLFSLIMALCLILNMSISAYADNPAPAPDGTLTISKKVDGDVPPETEFEFTVMKGTAAAAGKYTIDGGTEQLLPMDGKIRLRAGQKALLTELEPGEYTVTETPPLQSGYESTSFSVNDGPEQGGYTAAVTVTAARPPKKGGWKTEDGKLVKDAYGYYTYVLTFDQIDSDGKIMVDCDLPAEYMVAEMQAYQNFFPRSFKMKFINETGVGVQYLDYSFDTVNWLPVKETYTPPFATPSMLDTDEGAGSTSAGYGWGDVWHPMYEMLIGGDPDINTLDADGFDGNKVRMAIAPLRCINPAVVSYFSSNPGSGTLTGSPSTDNAQKITLRQMNALPELIRKSFSFRNWEGTVISLPADDSRTYTDFICAFYDVSSPDELTIAQKYNVLGTGAAGSPAMPYAGQSHITTYYANRMGFMSDWCIPFTALNDGTLDYFKTWGFSDTRIAEGKKLVSGGAEFSAEDAAMYAYQPNYYLMENDPDIISMAYDYLYERCIRFSLDTDDRPVSTAFDDSTAPEAEVGGIKDYIDRTGEATANVLKAMNNGAEIPDGDSLALDRVRGYIEVPNAWNQFRYYDFGFKLSFRTTSLPPEPAAVTFTNKYSIVPPPEPETGNLSVKKVLSGNAAESGREFDFTVTLGDASVSGVYGDMSFAGGKAVFSLKGGESRTAAGLPAGISYTVTEADYTAEGYKTTASGDTGIITDGKTAAAVFTNTKNDSPTPPPGPTPSPSPTPVPDTGNLSVMKVVSGNAAETDRAFGFTVTLTDTAVNGTYGEMSFTGGTAAFSLKGGESRTATGLPSGTGYTVTEEDCSADGYVTEISGGTGTVTHGKTSAAVFTNTRNALEAVPETAAPFMAVLGAVSEDPTTPDTGDGSGLMFWVLLLAASAAVLTGTAVYGFKKRNIN